MVDLIEYTSEMLSIIRKKITFVFRGYLKIV